MNQYDLTQPDYYSSRLAELNATNKVVTSEDILNHQNLLLIKKGQTLNSDMVHKILSHKLIKPLEKQVTLTHLLKGSSLQKDLMEAIEDAYGLHSAQADLALDKAIQQHCDFYDGMPLLQQKMTVLKERLPKEYDKALFCSWFCLAIAVHLEQTEAEQQAAFFGGLCHDLGMLHLDPKLIDKAGAYNGDEWRAMQSHTLIATAFLSHIPQMPKQCINAVLQHHERLDGTGYPQGLFEPVLSLLGQMIAISDMLYGIRQRGFKHQGRPLNQKEYIPILQINSLLFPAKVYSATIAILHHSAVTDSQKNSTKMVDNIVDLHHEIMHLKRAVDETLALADFIEPESLPRFKVVNIMMHNLHTIVASSGLLSEPMMRWLQHVQENGYRTMQTEVLEMEIMVKEIHWQLRHLMKVLQLAAVDAMAARLKNADKMNQAVALCEQHLIALGDP